MSKNSQGAIKTRRVSTRVLIAFSLLLLIGMVELVAILWQLDEQETNTSSGSAANSSQNVAQPSFNMSQHSVNEASSLWVVVNKGRQLPSSYIPSDLSVPDVPLRFSSSSDEMHLRADAAQALKQMFTSAAKTKIYLRLASGYRSYYSQSSIYSREVKNYGQTQADNQSARPGHSEHQTGLAADLEPSDRRCEIADCFVQTNEGKWLAANAHRYGFVLRYPSGKEDITGYKHEPWHFRYVGKELAIQIKQTGKTLEQFFGLSGYVTYPPDIHQLD